MGIESGAQDPDAINALLTLMDAPAGQLTSPVYNISAYNPSAGEFAPSGP